MAPKAHGPIPTRSTLVARDPGITNRSSTSNRQQHASPAAPDRHDSAAPNHSEEHYSRHMKISLGSFRRTREASEENHGDLQERLNGILTEVALIGPLLESSRQRNAKQAALIGEHAGQVASLNKNLQRKDVERSTMTKQFQTRDEELQQRIEGLRLEHQAKAARIQELESKNAKQTALTGEYAHKMATMYEESQRKDGELAAMAQKFHEREKELLQWIERLRLENRTIVAKNEEFETNKKDLERRIQGASDLYHTGSNFSEAEFEELKTQKQELESVLEDAKARVVVVQNLYDARGRECESLWAKIEEKNSLLKIMADRPSEADLIIQSTALQILALLRSKYSKGGGTPKDLEADIARAMDAQIEVRAERKLKKATKARRSSAPSLSSVSTLCEER